MSLVNCYELVKLVLDDTYSAIDGTDDAEKDAAVKEGLAKMSAAYSTLTTSGGPDYSEPASRVGYIFRYVTSHANLVYSVLNMTAETRALFTKEREKLTISCLGGGPGSDLLGVIKLLLAKREEETPQVVAYICDREEMWMDSWGDVGTRLPEDVRLHTLYFQQDVCDPSTWRQRKYLDADLFTMIYFMSEVYSRKDDAAAYFDNVFAHAKKGALFLFIDNKDERFSGWFEALASKHGVRILHSEDWDRTTPGDEQESVLQQYISRWGRTKLKTWISARIGVKE
jgi:hypothetical protein